jgi:hypothetical protein
LLNKESVIAKANEDVAISVTPFAQLRRALSNFIGGGIFCVAMDTMSRISNYMPSMRRDSSLRITRGNLLFPPWIYFDTIGSYPAPNQLESYVELIPAADSQSFFPIDFSPFQLITLSRPLFSGHLKKLLLSSVDIIWDSVCELANFKVSGGIPSHKVGTFFAKREYIGRGNADSSKEVEIRNIALIAMRLCVTPLNFLCQERMVSHYMATLLAISSDRESLLVQYVDEPFLGEAAAAALNRNSLWDDALEVLYRQFCAGHLAFAQDRGDAGELAGALITTLAYDAAVQHSRQSRACINVRPRPSLESMDQQSQLTPKTLSDVEHDIAPVVIDTWYKSMDSNLIDRLIYSRPVTVYQYLKTLLPAKTFDSIDYISNPELEMSWHCKRMLNGFVAFTQYHQAEAHVPISHADSLFIRRSATITHRLQTGYDLVIWVKLGDSMHNGNTIPGSYSAIFIECKNCSGKLSGIGRILDRLYRESLDTIGDGGAGGGGAGAPMDIEMCGGEADDARGKFKGKEESGQVLGQVVVPFINIVLNLNPDTPLSRPRTLFWVEPGTASVQIVDDRCIQIVIDGANSLSLGSFLSGGRLRLIQNLIRMNPITNEMIESVEEKLKLGLGVVRNRLKVMALSKNVINDEELWDLKNVMREYEDGTG